MKIYINRKGNFVRVAIFNNQLQYYNEIPYNPQGNIYIAEVKRICKSLNAAFVEYGGEKLGFLNFNNIHPLYSANSLRLNQKLLVQKLREESKSEFENKGALFTTFIKLGENFTYIPNALTNTFLLGEKVSETYKEAVLKVLSNATGEFLLKEDPPCTVKDFTAELKNTLKTWKKIIRLDGQVVHFNNPLEQLLKKNSTHNIKEVIFNGVTEKFLMPYFNDGVRFTKKTQVFKDLYNQVQDIFSKIVNIGSGAYLIFDYSTIGYTIDVNMGSKITGENDKAVLQVNLQAAEEIARQVKLRNLCGMILIDFVDLCSKEAKQTLNEKLKLLFQDDENRIRIENLNSFSIACISRQYKGGMLWKDFFEPSKLKLQKQAFDLICAIDEYEHDNLKIIAALDLIALVKNKLKHRKNLVFESTDSYKWKVVKYE